MPYVISTLANTQKYTLYADPPADPKAKARPRVPIASVVVLGGSGVMGAIHTPEGVVTKITEEEVEILEKSKSFQAHKKRGFIKIVNREVKPEKAAKDMPTDNGEVSNGMRVSGGSAPLSPDSNDFEEGGRAAGPAPAEVQGFI